MAENCMRAVASCIYLLADWQLTGEGGGIMPSEWPLGLSAICGVIVSQLQVPEDPC